MDTPTFIKLVRSQFDASLWMLHDVIELCPTSAWDAPVGKYPFWHVAYHVLCFVDVYAAVNNDAWIPDMRSDGLHPLGRTELDEEYPSRRFEQHELLAYALKGRTIVHAALDRETTTSLAGPSGFPWLPFTRAELHLYSIRHIQHHTGQLSAVLRKSGVQESAIRWRKSGWDRPL